MAYLILKSSTFVNWFAILSFVLKTVSLEGLSFANVKILQRALFCLSWEGAGRHDGVQPHLPPRLPGTEVTYADKSGGDGMEALMVLKDLLLQHIRDHMPPCQPPS